MLELSKYFKQDIIDTNQKLEPVLIIQDTTDTTTPTGKRIMFTLTVNQTELSRTFLQGDDLEELSPIACIEKVSNVKSSNDYDTKKLKINTLRFTLNNYYDVNTKLSEYINTGILKKNIYLFYKSPTTNNINLGTEITDYDCALTYKGIITRIKFDNKSINITAEDSTQEKISEKNVPYMTIDKLDKNISENIPKQYKNDNTVVPMTFGKVDKAPVLPYFEGSNDRMMNILLDVQPTFGHFKTSKIPAVADMTQQNTFYNPNNWYEDNSINIPDYYLYVKENNDYLILNHISDTINNQYQHYSTIKLASTGGLSNSSFLSDLAIDESSHFQLWSVRAFSQRLVESVTRGDNSILDIQNFSIEQVTPYSSNYEYINNFNNYPKSWYRVDDPIQSGNINFDTGLQDFLGLHNYMPNAAEAQGKGRWFIFKLEQGSSSKLLNIIDNSGDDHPDLGNTFFMSDHIIYQDNNYEQLEHISDEELFNGSISTGFFVAPISPYVWNNLIPLVSGDGYNYSAIKKRLMLITDEGTLQSAEDALNDSSLSLLELYDAVGASSTHSDSNQNGAIVGSDRKGAISLHYNENYSGNMNFWGNRGTNNNLNIQGTTPHIHGLYYGHYDYWQNNSPVQSVTADEFDNLAVFEFQDGEAAQNYRSGLKINNCGILQSVLAEKIDTKQIYASIVGRKNHLYTEELNQESFDMFPETEVESSYLFLGENETLPDFDLLIDETYNIISNTYNEIWSNTLDWQTFNPSREFIHNFVYTSDWNETLRQNWINNISDDSPFANTFEFFRTYIWEQFILISRFYYIMGAEVAGIDIYDGNNVNTDFWTDYYEETYGYSIPEGYNQVVTNYSENIVGPDDYSDINYRFVFTEESFVKPILKNIFEYVYKTNISGYENHLLKYNWFEYIETVQLEDQLSSGTEPFAETFIGKIQRTFNLDDTINTHRMFDWTLGYESVETLEEWQQYFYAYMDDYLHSVFKGITENIGSVQQSAYWSFHNGATEYANAHSGADGEEVTLYNPYWSFSFNESFYQNNAWANGPGSTDTLEHLLDNTLYSVIYVAQQYLGEEEIEGISTDGIIEKPSDIVMNILVNEMEFNKFKMTTGLFEFPEQYAGEILAPEYNNFDMDSINESRLIHTGWKMGFSINKKTNGKKLIEDILKESKSYPNFKNNGNFSLINIKEKYSYSDIDKIIDENDIINYTFNQTKIEDLVTNLNVNYRYDNGFNKYSLNIKKDILDILPEYTGLDYYSTTTIDTTKEMNLKYHTDMSTVQDFTDYTLLNRCNPHNEVVLELPLKYMELSTGDIIHLPLINNEKIFNIDYSKVEILNGQPIYPVWIILATDISANSVKIKAYQLHYLGTDGDHSFAFPDEEYDIVGNMKEFNSNYTFANGEPLPNWNYNPNATIDSGVEIPYFDLNGDGQIDILDLNLITDALFSLNPLSNSDFILSASQLDRIKYNQYGGQYIDEQVDVVKCVAMVNMILANGSENV